MINEQNSKLKKIKSCATKFGTPLYIVDEDELTKNARNLVNLFKKRLHNVEIFYPYKTNNLPLVCERFKEMNLGAEVSSILDLKLAIRLGVEKIIFNSPAKKSDEICEIIENDNVTFVADNIQQLRLVNENSKNHDIGVRIKLSNTDKKWERFGIEPKQFLENYKKCTKNRIVGMHFHCFTKNKNPETYSRLLTHIRNLILKLDEKTRKNIKFVDIGGGFDSGGYFTLNPIEFASRLTGNKLLPIRSIQYSMFKKTDMKSLAKNISESFEEKILNIKGLENTSLYLEPGRLLVNNFIHVLSSVLYVDKKFVTIDAGTNIFPRILYEHHPIINLSSLSENVIKTNIFCSLFISTDIIGNFVFTNSLNISDILMVMNIGAYSISQAQQFIEPLPKVISLKNGNAKTVRVEEDFEYRYKRDVG